MDLHKVASNLVAKSKGILAADESSGTIKKRFDTIGVESTEENRRFYRNLLFSAHEIEKYISGVILFDETLRQTADDGSPIPKYLADKGVIPGIKVDAGTIAMPGSPEEKITMGLDGLGKRLAEYVSLGAQFAKWRAVITIGPNIPTEECIEYIAFALAIYAKLCQEAGLVPIVEPEVLMDGDNTIDRCREVTEDVLEEVFGKLEDFKVDLAGMILKPNMITPGKKCATQVTPEEVAKQTIEVLNDKLPKDVPGVVFLSGGQSADLATRHLNAINKIPHEPYQCSFSFGRALQEEALKAWVGKAENKELAQQAFLKRAKLVSLARDGNFSS